MQLTTKSLNCRSFPLLKETTANMMIKQSVLPYCIALHLSLLMVVYAPNIGVCQDPTALDAKTAPNDVWTALQRAKGADTFHVAAIAEVALMSSILAGSCTRWLPSLLLVDAIVIRARHLGVGSCTPNDPSCCSALQCHQFPACTYPPFLNTTTNWHDRRNYCPLPLFYYENEKARLACSTLENTPDMSLCYQYGCSKKHTPFQHYMQRAILLSLLAVTFIALHCC